jgi:hypothetical protein
MSSVCCFTFRCFLFFNSLWVLVYFPLCSSEFNSTLDPLLSSSDIFVESSSSDRNIATSTHEITKTTPNDNLMVSSQEDQINSPNHDHLLESPHSNEPRMGYYSAEQYVNMTFRCVLNPSPIGGPPIVNILYTIVSKRQSLTHILFRACVNQNSFSYALPETIAYIGLPADLKLPPLPGRFIIIHDMKSIREFQINYKTGHQIAESLLCSRSVPWFVRVSNDGEYHRSSYPMAGVHC